METFHFPACEKDRALYRLAQIFPEFFVPGVSRPPP
jgi:hypothetical protein